jgi:hypothetical protein
VLTEKVHYVEIQTLITSCTRGDFRRHFTENRRISTRSGEEAVK